MQPNPFQPPLTEPEARSRLKLRRIIGILLLTSLIGALCLTPISFGSFLVWYWFVAKGPVPPDEWTTAVLKGVWFGGVFGLTAGITMVLRMWLSPQPCIEHTSEEERTV